MNPAQFNAMRNAQSEVNRQARISIQAKVTRAPKTSTEKVLVAPVNVGTEGLLNLGEAAWPQPSTKSLPAVGDLCLVTVDEKNIPYIVAWSDPWGQPPQLVSALPTNPHDGQEIYYQSTAMGEKGVVWTFRYRAASASTHKWEFVGGSEIYNASEVDQALTLTSGAFVYQDLATQPTVELPIVGDYILDWGANIIIQTNEATTELDMIVTTSANTVLTERTVTLLGTATPLGGWAVSRRDRALGLPTGTILKLRVAGNHTLASGYRTNNRYISARPIKVG